MKKLLLTVALTALAVSAFAVDFKASFGAYGGITGVGRTVDLTDNYPYYDVELSYGSAMATYGGFVDLTYLVISAGMETQLGKSNETVSEGPEEDKNTFKQDISTLSFKALAKYPLSDDPSFVFFPLLGVEYSLNLDYNIATAGKDDFSNADQDNMNDVLIDLGVGFDYFLSESVFLRAQAIIGINLDASFDWEESYYEYYGYTYEASGYSFGATVGLGYQF